MRKNLNWIVLVALVVGFCLCLTLCFVLFARLSRVERAARMAEERQSVAKSRFSPSLSERIRASDADIEIVRRSLHAAYKVERDEFCASHKNMGGGNYSGTTRNLVETRRGARPTARAHKARARY